MATKVYSVAKARLGRALLLCQGRGCDIRTNKRFRTPTGPVYVACSFDHGEQVYWRSQQRAAARAAA